MKNIFIIMMSLVSIALTNQIQAQVAINEITANGEVEIINTSDETIDISSYWLCDRPAYEQLRNLTISCGDLNLAAGASVTVVTSAITVNPAGDEMAIYSSSSFGSSSAIVDYVIWGNRSGSTRESTAAQANLWTTDQRAPAFSTTESLNWDGAGDTADDFETAASSICVDGMGACEVMGGTLTGGPFAFCAGDGVADNIAADEITLTGNTGPNSQWVVTDEDGNILGLPESFTDVNFDGAGPGTCLVWHLSFEDGLTGAEMGANANDLQGCFNLSNPISVVRSQPAGGTLTGGPFSFCVGDDTPDNIAADQITLSGNSGTNSQWVVTDEDGMILGLPMSFTDVDFDGAGTGTCLVWHLSFEDGLTGADIGANASDLQGCFSLSNAITVVRSDTGEACGSTACEAMGGTLTGGPFAFCVGDGEADNIAADEITLTGNTGPNSQWVVTDEDGNILGLPESFTGVNFDGAGPGTCLVWHLSFEDGLVGADVGANANDLQGCFNLSNPISVVRSQPSGGTLTGGPFSFCVGDDTPDNIAAGQIVLAGNSGTNSQWVVTDADGNILGLPGSFTDVDFDGAGVGTCLVWHLSFDGEISGAVVGANANDLQGCFSLSNPITVVRSDAGEVCGATVCEAMGGTLTGGPFTFCAGDGVADNITEDQVTLTGNSGTNSQWVVTDGQGNILGLPPTFTAVDFDGAGVGVCSVWHLSYEDGLTGLEAGGNVTNFGGCYSLSNPIEVIRTDNPEVCGTDCSVAGGLLTGGPYNFCVGDGVADNLAADDIGLFNQSGPNSQWVVTDINGNILGLPPTFTAVDFDGAGTGTCLVWHLSFEDGLTGAAVGANANDLQGCFSLSNPVAVVRSDAGEVCGSTDCEAMGGTLTGGPFTFCVGDGAADNIAADQITLSGNSGTNSQWVVTDADGNILGLPPTFTAVDFDGAGTGTCLVWHLSFEDGLEGAVVGANANDLQGCFNLSNPISVVRTNNPEVCGTGCNVAGGLLTGGPYNFCVGDGVADNLAADDIGLFNQSGPNSQWVVTDINGNILGLPPTFTAVDFDGAGVGTCLVWHLSFEDGLQGVVVGANANDLQGCFSLSNPVAVVRSQPSGGTLSGGPFEFCVGDGAADNIAADQIALSGNSGTNSQWVVTDADGNILGLPPTFSAVNFDGAGTGTCLVWHLSFEDGLEGAVVGANANDLQGCFSLSNPITVVRNDAGEVCNAVCNVSGGTLSGGPFTFTVGDGIADNIPETAITLSRNNGMNSQWVVTDAAGNILGLPPTFSAVNFDGAGAGTCLVWHLSFDGEISGAVVGANAEGLEGCFSLSNPISVVRENATTCQANGGELIGGPFTFTVGDGVADNIPADAIVLANNQGMNSQWVVTDAAGNILGLPPTFSAVNFDGAGAGTCIVWHLSFDGEISGAVVGANAEGLEGCFSLSNPISVIRENATSCQANGGELIGGPFTFTVGDGVADNIPADAIVLANNQGMNSQWVVTDESGNILGLPPTFSAVNFDGAGAGTCLVWHLSFDGDISGAVVGANAEGLEGCFSLSNPVSVIRENAGGCQANGGELIGGPFTFTVGDGVADNIPADAIVLANNQGMNSQWVVTDESGNILGLPPTFSAVNFDGAGAGTCLVWHLSFEDGLQGATVGANASDLQGCFSLSNPISVVRVSSGCNVDGGSIASSTGFTEFTICVGDGIPNPFDVHVNDNSGNNRLVITDAEGKILALPGTARIDLEGAGTGVCYVYNLAYDGSTTGIEVGANVDDIVGCYSLSNPITVDRIDCPANACQSPLNLRLTRKSAQTFQLRWDRAPVHVIGYEVEIGLKDKPRSFVTIPVRRTNLTITTGGSDIVVAKVKTICSLNKTSDFTDYVEFTPGEGASGRSSFDGKVVGDFIIDAKEFSISPNPASDFLDLTIGDIGADASIELVNTQGQRLLTQRLQEDATSTRIDIDQLESGMYMILVKSAGEVVDYQRVIVAK